ncbi:UDP-glucose/GDP-mannose dehydrogenase family protein [Priestia sp. FSL W8-0001]|uniref:UDP-glucose dehydrogenase family protein n=1 Tax=unclassified Priestia TaxID=2800374 RepID=UPI0030F590CB
MKVVVIGSGYVGSVTGIAFSALGHQTTVVDIDINKVNTILNGQSPIYEPGLDNLIEKFIGKTLSATTSYECVKEADVVFIGVGTPSREDGTADLAYIKSAAKNIGENLNSNRFTVIVNKSTVPVGTADLVSGIIEDTSGLRRNADFAVVSNPEFLREGFAIEDVFFPDRIVIGTTSEQARLIMRDLYSNLINRQGYGELIEGFQFNYAEKLNSPSPVYFETDDKSSELIKYASNAFLAVKISYVNEMARLCESLDANILDVALGMGLDSRIGNKFLQASSGWSGSCFPKDTAEILATSTSYNTKLSVVEAAVSSNLEMHDYCVSKVQHELKSLNGKTIGILGLTFKPNTDDARKTQASYIIEKLIALGARVKVHDPQGMEMFKSLNNNLDIEYYENPIEMTRNTDGIILLTHWNEYIELDWKTIFDSVRNPYVFDTRNVLNHFSMVEIGFKYEGLGISQYNTIPYNVEASV